MRWLSPRVAGFSENNPAVSIVLQHPVDSEDGKPQAVEIDWLLELHEAW